MGRDCLNYHSKLIRESVNCSFVKAGCFYFMVFFFNFLSSGCFIYVNTISPNKNDSKAKRVSFYLVK